MSTAATGELPSLTVLVHGSAESVAHVRARELSRHWAPSRVRILVRDLPRWITARHWWDRLRADQPEVVYLVNTALPGAVLAPLWARRTGRPFVLDTGDVIHEMAVRSGIPSAWKRPALRWIERWSQRRASTVVVRGTRHQEHLRSLGYRRVELIRDGYVPSPPSDAEKTATLKRQLGLEGVAVVGVLGSLVYSPRLRICYGWDLVEALARLRDLAVRGLIVGGGDGRGWLEEKAEALRVRDRLVFTGQIPYADVPSYLSLMDFALSTQTNNLPGQVRTTGKLPEYMAQARFVLASRVGEAALLLPEIMLVDYEGDVDSRYPERLATRIRQLIADPVLLDARLQLPRLAEEHCSYPVLQRRFAEVILAATAPYPSVSNTRR